jgi:tetratricopeptide (TPR) repeat protein
MFKKTFLFCIFILSLTTANDYYEYYKQGNFFEDIKNYTAAEKAYQRSIELEPNFAPAHNALGFVFLELNNFVQAKIYFKKALELQPSFILPLLNTGATYYREGNLAEAQKYFEKVLSIEPQNIRALTNLAVVKFKFGDYLGAFYYYTQAKGNNEAYLKERYNKEKSLSEIRAARAQNPDNPQLKLLEEKIKNDEIFSN